MQEMQEMPLGSVTGSGRSLGVGNDNPLQYSCLENLINKGAWRATVHGVAKSRARLSDFTFTFHFHALEKEMTTHSSILAWRIPGTEKPNGLLSIGLHRVGHDWSDLAAADLIITKTLSFLIIYNQSLNLWATDSLVRRMGRRAECCFFFFLKRSGKSSVHQELSAN